MYSLKFFWWFWFITILPIYICADSQNAMELMEVCQCLHTIEKSASFLGLFECLLMISLRSYRIIHIFSYEWVQKFFSIEINKYSRVMVFGWRLQNECTHSTFKSVPKQIFDCQSHFFTNFIYSQISYD